MDMKNSGIPVDANKMAHITNLLEQVRRAHTDILDDITGWTEEDIERHMRRLGADLWTIIEAQHSALVEQQRRIEQLAEGDSTPGLQQLSRPDAQAILRIKEQALDNYREFGNLDYQPSVVVSILAKQLGKLAAEAVMIDTYALSANIRALHIREYERRMIHIGAVALATLSEWYQLRGESGQEDELEDEPFD